MYNFVHLKRWGGGGTMKNTKTLCKENYKHSNLQQLRQNHIFIEHTTLTAL